MSSVFLSVSLHMSTYFPPPICTPLHYVPDGVDDYLTHAALVYTLPNAYIYSRSDTVTGHDTHLANFLVFLSSVNLLSRLSSVPLIYFFAIPMLER